MHQQWSLCHKYGRPLKLTKHIAETSRIKQKDQNLNKYKKKLMLEKIEVNQGREVIPSVKQNKLQ